MTVRGRNRFDITLLHPPCDAQARYEARKHNGAPLQAAAEESNVAGMGIRCQWFAVGFVTVVENDHTGKVVHRGIDRVPCANNHSRSRL
jgi:hypothetical protein